MNSAVLKGSDNLNFNTETYMFHLSSAGWRIQPSLSVHCNIEHVELENMFH